MEEQLLIDRPEVFFRQLHPIGAAGSIVLERKFNRIRRHSQVIPEDAEKLFRLSCKVPDVSFSAATFKGMPLLLNFESTSCIFAQFPNSPDLSWKLFQAIIDKGFSTPTFVVEHGENATAFWVLKKPIKRHDYHKVFLLQKGLLLLLSDFRPNEASLAVNTLVPLIGTINSKSGTLVGIRNYSGKTLDNSFAERFLLRPFGIDAADTFDIHSKAISEMLSLFHHRLFVANVPVQDWLLFFGASLCHFCPRQNLIAELRALAESLAGAPWSKIAGRYDGFIRGLANTALEGYVRYDDGRFCKSIDEPDWLETVAGKLGITQYEVDKLGLDVLLPDHLEPAGIKLDTDRIQPVGNLSFVPFERLFLKAA